MFRGVKASFPPLNYAFYPDSFCISYHIINEWKNQNILYFKNKNSAQTAPPQPLPPNTLRRPPHRPLARAGRAAQEGPRRDQSPRNHALRYGLQSTAQNCRRARRGHLPRCSPPLSARPSPPAQASPLRGDISPGAGVSSSRGPLLPARPDCPARPSPFAGGRFCRFPARGQPVLCRRPAAQRKRPAFLAGRFLSAYQNSEALTETA